LRIINSNFNSKLSKKIKEIQILKNKSLIIRFMCRIGIIILAIFYFIGHIESKILMPFIIINLLVLQIFNDKENDNFEPYTKYDGLKLFLSCILFLGIIIIALLIFHTLHSQSA
jgi:hypothetical protein